MPSYLKKIPLYLIYSRPIIGAIILFLAFHKSTWGMVILMIFGLLTDVFDGIIARKLEVSTEKLRRLDSFVDQIFWYSFLYPPASPAPNFWQIIILNC